MPPPPVTVIIPCWNGEAHVAATIRSLIAQSRQDFDLILLDDASEDRSADIAKEVAGSRIQIVRNPKPKGLAGNWNHAFSLAKTEYVCLAHADDVYAPRFVEVMLDHMEHNPDAGLAHCRARTIDEDGNELVSPIEQYKKRFWSEGETADRADVFRRLYHGNYVCCPSIMYRRRTHEALGGFSETVPYCTDWDFLFRTLLAGFEIAAVPETLISYRRHQGNLTRDHAASLNRYSGEIQTLEMALFEGKKKGLLGNDTRASLAVRNNLLYDSFADFEAGRVQAALDKLEFGKRELPGFAKDKIAKGMRMCLRMGRPGLGVLRLGLWAYLRLAPKRVS